MSDTQFQRGKFYTLPIVDIRDEGQNAFFIVLANEREYPIRMFDFQRKDQRIYDLKELPCMVKDVHGSSILFVQNFAKIFGDKYESGIPYQFIVSKEVPNPLNPHCRYYDVTDEDSVPFRIRCSKDIRLMHGQKVQCMVNRVSENKLSIVLLHNNPNSGEYITIDKLLTDADINPVLSQYLIKTFKQSALFEEARNYHTNHRTEWIIKALLAIQGDEDFITLRNENRKQLLEAYHRLCLYILEDSNYLVKFFETERLNYQEWISERISRTETQIECLHLIEENKCSEEIDKILRKIKNSGYIYEPKKKMDLLISIFLLQPTILEEKIETILDIVAACAKDWKQPSFNHAFSRFLQFYVMSNRERVNREAAVVSQQSKQLLNRMVRAICYLLIMTNDANTNGQLYRSMLYHYLSFAQVVSADSLIDRAFNALFLTERMSELSWKRDYTNTEPIAVLAKNSLIKNSTFINRAFETENVRFNVSSDSITLSRVSASKKEKNVIPEGYKTWHNLQIFLDADNKLTISKDAKFNAWSSFWKNIETELFEVRKTTTAQQPIKRIIYPEVGTEVYVRITGKDTKHNRFLCKIEDDIYTGSGHIDTYIKGGSTGMFHYNPEFDVDSFYYDGKPMLIKVRVNSIGSPHAEEPTFTFDALSLMDESLKDNTFYGEESNCYLITYIAETNHFLGISENGYSLYVPRPYGEDDSFECNTFDTVRVRLLNYNSARAMQGEIIGPATAMVSTKSAGEKALRFYVGDNFYEEDEEELEEEAMEVAEDFMDVEHVKEIINIYDHKSAIEKDNCLSYAFLSMAHILSRMIDDKDGMNYIEQRRQLLSLLDRYGETGKITDSDFELLNSIPSDLLEKYPRLKEGLLEVKIVDCFGKHEENDFLWDIAKSYDNQSILSQMARLMLSYNMADGFGLQEHQKVVADKINNLININVKLPEIYSFGNEDQRTEFKTSIVFPPNDDKPNMQLQTFNIMKVIGGMLNSYGGTLYLGVRNTGFATGLADDLRFFENSTDKFDLYVRNQIRFAFGDAVNASVSVKFPTAGKHFIYALSIPPSPKPVCLKTDNKFYLREGTSTYFVEEDELREIMNKRQFAQYELQEVTIDVPAEEEKEVVEEPTPIKPKATPTGSVQQLEPIPTSRLRSNVVDNWREDYGLDTTGYLRFLDYDTWELLDDIEWEDGVLTLAIHEAERDGFLIIAYQDGTINKVPFAQILEQSSSSHRKLNNQKKIVFACPAKKDAALLTAYLDDKGKLYFRLDDMEYISEGKMNSDGKLLTDVEFNKMIFCEIINKEHHDHVKKWHNRKRTDLGFPCTKANAEPYLKRLGIDVESVM